MINDKSKIKYIMLKKIILAILRNKSILTLFNLFDYLIYYTKKVYISNKRNICKSKKLRNSRGLRVFRRSISYAKKRFLYILLFIMYIIESKMDIIAEKGPDIQKMVMSVVNQRQNQNSRQTYYTALTKFFDWYVAGDNEGIDANIIREYLLYLENYGKSKATISTSLSVLRQLFKDLRRMEVIDEKICNDLLEIKFKKPLGQRHKTWLEQEEVQKLLNNLNSENEYCKR